MLPRCVCFFLLPMKRHTQLVQQTVDNISLKTIIRASDAVPVSDFTSNPFSVRFGHFDAELSKKSKAETKYRAPEYSDFISLTMQFVMW